ncbi:MAG: DUF1549 and DUF1553 domain-containing protein, partial [Planctomycetota bacterium]|nr:DUF1549 and DUF1553 domain-containing protein [Planctomycetota bacterium]
VLSKAGCNLGVCHGNKNGKGGFKLSLRGEDPEWDFQVLTRDQNARRINPVDPSQSLVLRKSTMEIPHEGGRRFRVDSPEYAILTRWLANGARNDAAQAVPVTELIVEPTEAIVIDPEDTVSIRVRAKFADGRERDVTRLAVYDLSQPIVEVSPSGKVQRLKLGETTVVARYLSQQAAVRLAFIPNRSPSDWRGPAPANFIDELVLSRLRALRINAADPTTDSEFVRRVHLDLIGLPPTLEAARRFVADSHPEKRARLIDELLDRPEFADYWAQKWGDLLRNEERTLDRKGVQDFHAWIRAGIDADKPVDQFTRELIASRGSTYAEPATNYYRALRDPIERSETTAQVFLGVRLQCAKCHSHPFDRWTQDDYYRWGALFARVDYRIIENRRTDTNDSHEFDGEQIVFMKRAGEVADPRTNAPALPKFLGGIAVEREDDRLWRLADWLGNRDNERFIATQVNRIWYHLMGRGIVDPIDDFRATNPASNPELLSALCADFTRHNCRLKHLARVICNSKVYQFSVRTDATNADDETNFSHARPQRLAAEVLLDALSQTTEAPLSFAGYPAGFRAGEIPGIRAGRDRDRGQTAFDSFLKLFGKPPRQQSCECERSNEPTLSQALNLVSGDVVAEMLTQKDNRLSRLLKENLPISTIADELFWCALSRPATSEERAAIDAHVANATDPRAAWEDVFWSLLNSREFLMRR